MPATTTHRQPQRALGRPPRDFADFARQAAGAGAWDQGRKAP